MINQPRMNRFIHSEPFKETEMSLKLRQEMPPAAIKVRCKLKVTDEEWTLHAPHARYYRGISTLGPDVPFSRMSGGRVLVFTLGGPGLGS